MGKAHEVEKVVMVVWPAEAAMAAMGTVLLHEGEA